MTKINSFCLQSTPLKKLLIVELGKRNYLIWDNFNTSIKYINLYFLLEEPHFIFSMANDYRFRPRILIDVSHIDMATNILGFNISMPIMIAPSAMQKMAHPEGPDKMFNFSFLLISKEKFSWRNYLECRRACYGKSSSLCRNNNGLKDHNCDTSVITQTGQTLIRCADSLFFMFFQTLSSWSTSSVEEVNSVGPGIRFFQLYVWLFFISMYLQEALLVLCSSD